MIKIDLVTGFLGSGKTTFIKQYSKYLIDKGMRIGILENDYGAVNVDMMLLLELEGENCTLEMVSGGCDADCHRRRFKTKLIAMGMSNYDRVLVEPSGIFDVDEFFDALYEEPLSKWYEIGNIFAIADAKLEKDLSDLSQFLLASQLAGAGKVILSKTENADEKDMQNTVSVMNIALEKFQCERRFYTVEEAKQKENIKKEDVVFQKNWSEFMEEDFDLLYEAGYQLREYVKTYTENGNYQSLYFMHVEMDKICLQSKIKELFSDRTFGNVFRIKGFIKNEEEGWLEINATNNEINISPIANGQDVMIVIGENLNEDKIKPYLYAE